MASTSISHSGRPSAETATWVVAGVFFPKNSSRIGTSSSRYRMSVRTVVIFTMLASVPPPASTWAWA